MLTSLLREAMTKKIKMVIAKERLCHQHLQKNSKIK